MDNATIGLRLKKVRNHLGLTQKDFALKVRISPNFICQIESGSRMPSKRTIKDICREFSVSEEWIYTGNGDMITPTANSKIDSLTKSKELVESLHNLFVDLSRLSADELRLLGKICYSLAEADEKEDQA